jgi:hypothetical protein
LYVLKFFKKKLTSEKLLITETSLDSFSSLFFLLIFGHLLHGVGMEPQKCVAGLSSRCDSFNMAITWTFCQAAFWTFSLTVDIVTWIKVIHGKVDSSDDVDNVLRTSHFAVLV